MATAYLTECNIPNTVHYSFVRGEVHTAINDAVFQAASGHRWAYENKAAAPTSNNDVYRWWYRPKK